MSKGVEHIVPPAMIGLEWRGRGKTISADIDMGKIRREASVVETPYFQSTGTIGSAALAISPHVLR